MGKETINLYMFFNSLRMESILLVKKIKMLYKEVRALIGLKNKALLEIKKKAGRLKNIGKISWRDTPENRTKHTQRKRMVLEK